MMLTSRSGIIETELRDLIDAARDESLGPHADRGAHKAFVGTDGKWTGGIRWERSPLAVNVEGAPRCYTIGQSYQAPRNMSGPARGARVGDGELREHHVLRQKIARVSYAIVVFYGLSLTTNVGWRTRRNGGPSSCTHFSLQHPPRSS